MPPVKSSCKECGRSEIICPDCGKNFVSIDSLHGYKDYPPGGGHLSPDFKEFGMFAEEGDVLEYRISCWNSNCGWEETRKLSVEVE